MGYDVFVARKVPLSIGANGPGRRFVLWVQGCSLRCPGCCNPEFQPRGTIASSWLTLRHEIELAIDQYNLDGLTLTGGEPMDQATGLLTVLRSQRWVVGGPRRSSLLIFTGYTPEEIGIHEMTDRGLLWRKADIVVSGRYNQKQRIKNPRGLLASRNQRVYFPTGRMGPKDLKGLPVGEVIVDGAGNAVLTGMSPGVLD